ncbi:MAG: hypothetical protein KDI06_21675 [Calditrichaeota bacterium]|nr:hypothetical protein [Calditrichota bacterium]HQU73155.1 hypothetical protein [Calditrichia bacterium]
MKSTFFLLMELLLVVLFAVQAQEWQAVDVEDGNFRISFPGTPQDNSTQVSTDLGIINFRMLSVEYRGISFLAGYSKYPESVFTLSPDTLLAKSLEGAMGNVPSVLKDSSRITIGDYPGLAANLSIKDGQGVLQVRYYLVGATLYQLMTIYPVTVSYPEDVRRFFDAFAILGEPEPRQMATLLTSLETEFELDENGTYNLTVFLDDDRSQLLYIAPIVHLYNASPGYELWTIVREIQGAVEPALTERLLALNAEMDLGNFQLLDWGDNTRALIFAGKIQDTINAEQLRNAILTICLTADDLEAELTGKDDN